MMIQFENVGVAFNGQQVLENVNLEIKEGEFVSLVGETGVGKTTFLRLLYFDVLPTKGSVTVGMFNSERIRRKEIPQLRQSLGVAFQDFKLLDDRNVFDNVAITLEVIGTKRDIIQEQVLKALVEVGMDEKRNAMPSDLSGGEQQRVALARAMVNQPDVLLVDEPTGNLDPLTASGILDLLKKIHQNETTVVMASHNYDIVRKSGSRILKLGERKVEEVTSID